MVNHDTEASGVIAEAAATYLEQNAEKLVVEWIDWVQSRVQTTAVSALPDRALRNHVPPILLSLARYLRFPAELAREELLSHLKLHGQIRRDQGYGLREVLAEFDGLAAIVTNGVNQTIEKALADEAQNEALDVATRLATGLRSVSFIAMGTFDASDQERARSLSEKLEDFARTVAHELRGPLQTMTVGLALLKQKLGGQEETLKQIEALEAAAARSEALIDSMLVLALAEQARARTHLVALEETVTQTKQQFVEKAHESGVKLQFEAIPDIKVERAVIEIVLANLIGNAIKYSDPEKETRWVSLVARIIPEEDDSGFCEIEISDNGLGIPDEFLPRICQRGFRAHPERAQGTGLGLYIVQQLLTERGGSIKVDSVEGEGSIVTVRLRGLVGDCSALTAEYFDVDRLLFDPSLKQADPEDENCGE